MNENSLIQNILICDDHYFIQLGIEVSLQEILSQQYTVHKASSGTRAIEVMRRQKIDLALVDLHLPDISGIEVIAEIKRYRPKTKIVVVTSCDQAEVLLEVKKNEVNGIIQKSTSSDYLRACLTHISHGETTSYIDPHISHIIGNHEVIEFTAKECEVLKGIVQGFTNQELADQLGIALSTVRFHRANIMSKSGMRNAAELTGWYLSGKGK